MENQQKNLVEADLEAAAATFKLAADDEAVDEILAAFETRLAYGPIPKSSPLHAYAASAGELLDRFTGDFELDALEGAVRRAQGAAVALSPGLTVALANTEGRKVFSAIQGRAADLSWLHPDSKEEFDALRAAAAGRNNRRVGILRIFLTDGFEGLAQASIITPHNEPVGYIVVRKLDLSWSDEISRIVEEAYGLTKSEISVAQRFFRGETIREIAEVRGKSELTVRTQLRSVMEKMGVASQVSLIRTLGVLCATREEPQIEDQLQWSDPWDNEQTILRSDGIQVGYTSTGMEEGRPLLVLHGFSHGYLLGTQVEETLAERGFRMIAPYKHGCGSSGFSRDLDDLEDFSASVRAVVKAEAIKGCPVLAIGSGAIPAILLSLREPDLFSSIIGVADSLPLTEKKLSRLSLIARSSSRVGRDFPAVLTLAAKAGYRNVRRQGIDWYLRRRFSENAPDRATRINPETAPLLRNTVALLLTQPPELFAEQFRQRWHLQNEHFKELPIPFHIMLGKEDLMLDAEQIDELSTQNEMFSAEIVEDAGELLMFQQPEAVLARLAQRLGT